MCVCNGVCVCVERTGGEEFMERFRRDESARARERERVNNIHIYS